MKNSIYLLKFIICILVLLSGCSFKQKKIRDIQPPKRAISSLQPVNLIFFNNWDHAKNWYESKYSNVFGKILNRKQISNKSQYEKIERITEEILNLYFSQFPELKKHVEENKLQIILYNSKKFDARVVTEPSEEANYYALLFSNYILHQPIDAQKILVAHELAHIFFHKNSTDPNNILPKKIFYEISQNSLGKLLYGNIYVNEDLQYNVKLWKEYAYWWGGVADPMFNNLGAIHTLSYSNFIFSFYNNIFNSGCLNIKNEMNEVLDLAYEYEDSGRLQAGLNLLSKAEKDKFKILSVNLEKTINNCMNSKKFNITKELVQKGAIQSYGVPPGIKTYKKFYAELVKNALDKDFAKSIVQLLRKKITTDIFFKITFMAYEKMKSIEKHINISNIRSYSREDHADEMAIKILSESNIEFDSYFNKILNYKKGLNKSCDFFNNKEPPTNLIDTHNTPCWRYWRIKQLEIL